MGLSTSASYHHVHLPDDLTQLDHSEAVHAVWMHTEIFPLVQAAQTQWKQLQIHYGNKLSSVHNIETVEHNMEPSSMLSDSPPLQGTDGVDLCDAHNGSEGF